MKVGQRHRTVYGKVAATYSRQSAGEYTINNIKTFMGYFPNKYKSKNMWEPGRMLIEAFVGNASKHSPMWTVGRARTRTACRLKANRLVSVPTWRAAGNGV